MHQEILYKNCLLFTFSLHSHEIEKLCLFLRYGPTPDEETPLLVNFVIRTVDNGSITSSEEVWFSLVPPIDCSPLSVKQQITSRL